ncbi:MAG: hypothetical protein RQ826_14565 [Xanthomonadales bacterium]|nr:hypothetical protein [Xanthomonadales bacterium]
MRTFIYHLLVFSVLCASAEGAWDMARESHAHQQAAHQLDADSFVPSQSDPAQDDDKYHCGHLCHGHTSAIAMAAVTAETLVSKDYLLFNSLAYSHPSQAPPTPPPNA